MAKRETRTPIKTGHTTEIHWIGEASKEAAAGARQEQEGRQVKTRMRFARFYSLEINRGTEPRTATSIAHNRANAHSGPVPYIPRYRAKIGKTISVAELKETTDFSSYYAGGET